MARPIDHLNEELTAARKNLTDVLGAKMKIYLQFIKSWLKKKVSTVDFDIEARSLLTPEYAHLHNSFLLALLSKCQSMGSLSTNCDASIARNGRRSRDRPYIPTIVMNPGLYRKFLPADPLSQAPQLQSQPLEHGASMPEYVSKDLFLPDTNLMHGRMLVSSWEHDLEGVDDDAIEIMVLATEIFLKNILMALACHKHPFALKKKRFKHAIGSWRLSSWLSSSLDQNHYCLDSDDTSLSTEFTDEGYIPSLKPSPSLAEQEAAIKLSKAGTGHSHTVHQVTLFDLLEVLQVRKNITLCHTIYTLMVERTINRMNHPTREEEEEVGKIKKAVAKYPPS